jgi:patatin-like phospholipase/acyl hydrolase
MKILNSIPERRDRQGEILEPRDIFDLVAGISTGGLIAIMLGKMGMNIRECIYAYQKLSGEIFSKKSICGRFTGGALKPRYDGVAI